MAHSRRAVCSEAEAALLRDFSGGNGRTKPMELATRCLMRRAGERMGAVLGRDKNVADTENDPGRIRGPGHNSVCAWTE